MIYGPFYRVEPDETAKLQVESKEVWGRARRNIYQGINPAVLDLTSEDLIWIHPSIQDKYNLIEQVILKQ